MPYQFGDPGWLLVAALAAVLAAFLLALPAIGLVAGKARAWRREAGRAMATRLNSAGAGAHLRRLAGAPPPVDFSRTACPALAPG